MFFTRLLRKLGRKSARQNRQEFGLNQRIKSIYIRQIHFAELLFSVQTKRLNAIHINKVKRDPAKAEPHFQEKETTFIYIIKMKLDPTEAEPSFQEKEI